MQAEAEAEIVDNRGTPPEVESSMSTVPTRFQSLFTETTDLSDDAIAAELIAVPRSDRGSGKDRNKIRTKATESLSSKFGVPRQFQPGSKGGGEAEDGQYEYIQESFIGVAHKMRKVQERCEQYDMLTSLQIPELVNKSDPDPKKRWGRKDRNLLDKFGSITLEECLEWSKDIRRRGEKEERENMTWILTLIKNSCTDELSKMIDKDFDKLDIDYRTGVVYIKMMLDVIIYIDDNVVNAMKAFIKSFGEKGLFKIPGESPKIAELEVGMVCKQLDEVGKLPEDAPKDVLAGLVKCSHQEFVDTFKLIKTMNIQKTLSIGGLPGTPMEKVEKLFSDAVIHYNSYYIAGEWHVQKKKAHFNACWNCGAEDHMVGSCPEPRDEAKIEENKKKTSNNYRSHGNQNSSNRNGSPNNQTTKNHKKFTPAKPGETVHKIKGRIYCSCKECGWNLTHSSKYHLDWEQNRSAFPTKLPDNHPFKIAIEQQRLSKASGRPPFRNTNNPTSNQNGSSGGGIANSGSDHQAKMAKFKEFCEKTEGVR